MHNPNTVPFLNNHIQLTRNRILDALPKEEYEQLLPFLEFIPLPQGKLIFQPECPIRYVYFPVGGMISITSSMEDGKIVEIGAVGKEGMAGVDVILGVDSTPYESMVQIPGEGFRLKTEVIRKEFRKCGSLQDLLLRYTHALMVQSSQAGACNRLHTVEQKLATWMMICHDRVESNHLPLTQEYIATMLGVNRPTVSLTAARFQSEGIIEYRRGKINILNLTGLEQIACECYQTIKTEYIALPV